MTLKMLGRKNMSGLAKSVNLCFSIFIRYFFTFSHGVHDPLDEKFYEQYFFLNG